jgi:hypothetical protein
VAVGGAVGTGVATVGTGVGAAGQVGAGVGVRWGGRRRRGVTVARGGGAIVVCGVGASARPAVSGSDESPIR